MSDDPIQVPAGLTTEGLLWRRYFARFIDWFIVLVLGAFAVGAIVSGQTPARSLVRVLATFGIMFVVWIGYFTLLESSRWQATLGKRLFGLRVFNGQGGRPKPAQILVRSLVKDGPFILIASIPGGQLLSLIWVGAHLVVMHRSPVYQAIHDRAAKTWVAAPEPTTQLRIA